MIQVAGLSVLDAAKSRLRYIFQEFDNVQVSFSGGKDSGVLLNLALLVAKEEGYQNKLGVFHLDYEAQYTATTEYVDQVYNDLGDAVENLRCCVPVKVNTCTSMHQTHWWPWHPDQRDIWARDLPEYCLGESSFDFHHRDMMDYEFQSKFGVWNHQRKKAKKTAVLVGIRSDESLDRWRTIVSDRNINKYNGNTWSTKQAENVYNFYPIYDWRTDDVWVANAKFGWSYNKLYDLFHYAGLTPHQMRVASPFISAAKGSLQLYKAIDPHVWGKLVSRVNGVNFTALYGSTKAMGWNKITKPSHLSWKDYALFLLDTLPSESAAGFRKKLETSIKFWRNKGGVLGESALQDLSSAGIEFEVGEAGNYKTNKLPVRMEYADEINSKDFALIPTWKRLCVTIMKNDHVGKYMGFSQTKAETEKRRAAIEKYKDL